MCQMLPVQGATGSNSNSWLEAGAVRWSNSISQTPMTWQLKMAKLTPVLVMVAPEAWDVRGWVGWVESTVNVLSLPVG